MRCQELSPCAPRLSEAARALPNVDVLLLEAGLTVCKVIVPPGAQDGCLSKFWGCFNKGV